MNLQALAAELGMKIALLERGQLNASQTQELTELSRELYERLVVLRYKALEALVQQPVEVPVPVLPTVAKEPIAPAKTAEPTPVAVELPKAAPSSTSSQEPVFRANESEPEPSNRPQIRFGEPEVSPNQISLIDSIEEIQREKQAVPTVASKAAAQQSDGPTLAERLRKTPIPNLKTAIGINQKFLYITTLFGDDKNAYAEAVDRLNSFASFIEADEYIQNVLKTRYEWQIKNPVVKEFLELVERRYL
jgi:hypothetical protein